MKIGSYYRFGHADRTYIGQFNGHHYMAIQGKVNFKEGYWLSVIYEKHGDGWIEKEYEAVFDFVKDVTEVTNEKATKSLPNGWYLKLK